MKRRILLLLVPGLFAILGPLLMLMLFVVVILIPIAFLLAPFQGGSVPPPGITSVTQVYLPYERAAVKKYQRCTKVPVYSGTGAKKKITGYKEICHGVTVPFVQAIMRAESGGWALAVSNAGALGLMQVTTGKFQGDLSNGKSPFDPKLNIMRGVEYLDNVYFQVGENLPLTAAGYNAGPGTALQWMAEYHTSRWSAIEAHQAVQSFARGQTYNYVNLVMRYYNEINNGQCATLNSKFSACN